MSNPFIGEIRLFAGNFAPQNWAFCAGQLLAISQNNALFALIGTTYGGDGISTFALPDLRGRVPMDQGNGPGLTPRLIGQMFGTETVTLNSTQIPAHNHLVNGSSATATTTSPTGGVLADRSTSFYTANNTALVTLPGNTIGNTGGSLPHNNMMPYLGLSFIISLFGIFPSRS
jgi:microcystin-dependent protein